MTPLSNAYYTYFPFLSLYTKLNILKINLFKNFLGTKIL